LGILTQNHP